MPSIGVPDSLANALFGLMSHAADLLSDKVDLGAGIAAISEQASDLVRICEPAAGRRRFSWTDRIAIVRSLDRCLAMLSVLDGEIEASTGCVAFDSISHEASQSLVQIIRRMKQLSKPDERTLFASGPLVNLAVAGVASVDRPVYSFGTGYEAGRRRLLGGVAADMLDLIDELTRASPPRSTVVPDSRKRDRLRTSWQDLAASLGFKIVFQAGWVFGGLADADRFASALGITPAELETLRLAARILGVRWWDGSYRYPLLQLDTSGKPRAHLSELLGMVHSSVSGIALAVWLGRELRGRPRFEWLEVASDFDQLHLDLQEFDLIKQGVPHLPTPSVILPTASEIAAAYSDGLWEKQPGDGDRLERAWVTRPPARKVPAPRGELFRITSRTRGPFFFSEADPALDTGGRFDLSDGVNGTCYLAFSEEGAYGEVFRRLLVLDTQEAASRLLWRVRNFDTLSPLLDIRPGKPGSTRLGTGMDINAIRTRPDTHRFATQAHVAGYKGLLHQLARSGEDGLSLFGIRGGGIPEKHGVGSWHAAHELISDRLGFWDWLSGNNPVAMMNQLPLRRVV